MSLSALKLAAGAGATVTSMVVGSFFGDNGTIIGAASGSVVYGVAAEGYEYAAMRAHKAAKTRLRRNPAVPEKVWPAREGPSLREQAEGQQKQERRLRPKPLMLAGSGLALAGVSFAGALAFMSATEAATGQTLHAVTTGTTDYGSTWSSSTTPPSPSISPPATADPSTSPPSPSPTETLVPTVVPTVVPTITVTPSITSVPATPSSPPSVTVSP